MEHNLTKYKISVVMPVYNEQKFLRYSIDSILNQTFKDFEFIIIDDGSTDNSAGIIESYNDSRIRFFRSENKRMVYQFNFGISMSSAPIIARMDADDIAEKDRFEEQFYFLQQHPEIHVVGSNVLFINENTREICKKNYPQFHTDIEFMMPVESAICHPAIMIRKEVFDHVGLYNEKYDYAADHDLFLNLILNGYQFYNIQKILLRYRVRVLRKDLTRVGNSNDISYQLGINYLNKIYSNIAFKGKDYSYYYRMGLIEYYRGSISKSHSLFWLSIRLSKKHFFRIFRYFIMSLLGESLIKYLRKTKVLPWLSFYINKYLRIDLHNYKS